MRSKPSHNLIKRLFYNSRFSDYYWKEFKHPSTLEISDLVDKLLEPVSNNEYLYRTKLGLHEAIINAVIHGNSCDPTKIVRVRRILTPNWLVWQVQDQGNGYEYPDDYVDLPDNIESDNGRGLFLINQCFDDVRWSNKGNRLQLANRN